MELKELTAYAAEKYRIQEQHKWSDFPGFSVLADPGTGKWIALLMRQWDQAAGEEFERCDIKCGRLSDAEREAPWLSKPFRMKGNSWVGVRFDADTEAEAVFRLLDRAVTGGEKRGCLIVLDTEAPRLSNTAGDLPLLFTGAQLEALDPDAPDQILEMRKLYAYGDGSFAQKNLNFYRQGRYMEHYTDDFPWAGEFRHYFPTYHDLNVRQLRGYFTWRSRLRNGEYRPTAESFAYIYLYELLCGIGTASPEESLQKLREFEQKFLDAGYGSDGMRKNLKRWMLEYAILHDLPAERVREYADPALLERDYALSVLHCPEEQSDGEVFKALCVFSEGKLMQSPVVSGKGEQGERLFAAVWRRAMSEQDFFTLCFGERKEYPWRPLSNAVHYEEQAHPAGSFVLNPCRSYRCRGGVWTETRYDPLAFDKARFQTLLHEADRQLRRWLKTGHYLREKRDEAWAAPLVLAVIQAEEEARREAARPRVTLDLTGLERIRRDAIQTRDSLLTEAELEEERPPQTETKVEPPDQAELLPEYEGLDALHVNILCKLLRDGTADAMIQEKHLMPAVVADTINEALMDEIGDSVLECDGGSVTLVEDYRGDLEQILGGKGT